MNQSNKTKPLVSVIIPTYNRAHCIIRAVNSVANQTYKNIEIIIVDNSSTDNTLDLIKSQNKKNIYLYNIDNKGVVASSRNLGIKNSKGKYVAFLDSDDWWLPKKIEISIIELEKGFDIVYHDLFHAYDNSLKPHFWRRSRTRNLHIPVYRDLLINGNAINLSSVVIRKVLMEEINGFSQDIKLVSSEDYETWIRISIKTNKFSKINNVLGFYWKGGGNMTSLQLTLTSMNHILSIYSEDIKRFSNKGSVGFDYTICRAYYAVSNYRKAAESALIVIFKLPRFILLLKVIFTLFVSLILVCLIKLKKILKVLKI